MKKFLITSVAVSLMGNIALGQDAATASASPSPSPAGTTEVERVVIQSQEMDITREQIVPSLGATRYTVSPDRLDSQAQGEDAPFNQTMLRFPGVAQDSFGQLHVRGQHFAHYRRAASTVWISQYWRNRYPHKERRRFPTRRCIGLCRKLRHDHAEF